MASENSGCGARSRFYRASDKVRAAEDRLRRAEKLLDGGDLKDKAAQIEAEQGFLLNLGDSLDEYSKWVKEVREEIVGVQRQDLPTAEKRQRIKALEKEEAALYDEFMRIFKEEERKQKAAG